MTEPFGCCMSRIKCSDFGECIQKEDPEYSGCQYRKNLEAGKIFYGRNAGNKVQPRYINNEIYLICRWKGVNNPFAIRYRIRGLSYSPNVESIQRIEEALEGAEIPYDTDLNNIESRYKPSLGEICNSRAVVQIGEDEFNILNYNCWLIPEYRAQLISKAFEAKGFKSRVEVVGVQRKYIPPAKKDPAVVEVTRPKRVVYEQISLLAIGGR